MTKSMKSKITTAKIGSKATTIGNPQLIKIDLRWFDENQIRLYCY